MLVVVIGPKDHTGLWAREGKEQAMLARLALILSVVGGIAALLDLLWKHRAYLIAVIQRTKSWLRRAEFPLTLFGKFQSIPESDGIWNWIREAYERKHGRIRELASMELNRRFVNAMPCDLWVRVTGGRAVLKSVAKDISYVSSIDRLGTVAGVKVYGCRKGFFHDTIISLLRHCEGKDDPIVLFPSHLVDLLDSSDISHVLLMKRIGIPNVGPDGEMYSYIACYRSGARFWQTDEENSEHQ